MRLLTASLVVCLGLGACSAPDQSGTLAQRVRAWSSGAGLSATASHLAADAAQFRLARAKGDQVSLQGACGSLLNDASMAAAGLPTPDTALTADLNSAYDAYYRAAQLCLSRPPSGPTPSGPARGRTDASLSLAAAHLAKGASDLSRAQARVRVLVG